MLKKFLFSTCIVTLLSGVNVSLWAQATDDIPASVFKAHREKVRKLLVPHGIAFYISAPSKSRVGDSDYPYRQDNTFYYLTGMGEKSGILVLVPERVTLSSVGLSESDSSFTEMLFLRDRNKSFERWTGRTLGMDGARNQLGIECVFPLDKFQSFIDSVKSSGLFTNYYLKNNKNFYASGFAKQIQILNDLLAQVQSDTTGLEYSDPIPFVDRQRGVKSSEEISLIRKACRITALAHNQAMMSCTPWMYEYELAAIYEYVYKKMGAFSPAYPSIVGAGDNGTILHYDADTAKIEDGDLIVADCGAEYKNYASDLTRTYPANGKFSKEQKEVYELVLMVNKAAIAAMKPGTSWKSVSQLADSLLEEGLSKLGLIKEKDKKQFRKFFPHGLGHPVGLAVHDMLNPKLEPGVVYAVEPGIYFPDAMQDVPASYRKIGVRIEDTVLITETGNEVLTKDAVKEIKDVEAMMKKKGIGNIPIQ
jgi:Xaa-Pro aminopeptidase